MNKNVDRYIAEHKDDIIRTLRESLQIRSVEEPELPGAPFGQGVRDALTHMLKTAEDMGFSCTDMDGYCGCIDYGTGDELLGIMCHLDVVPEGIGWKHPPYSAEIEDGKIYARGTLDDKGPTVSTLFALAAIKACGIKMKRRVRIILGCNEETGWRCMDHYTAHGEEPHLAFSPDANYPLVNSEKGILHLHFRREFASKLRIESGSRANVVPNDAKVVIPLDMATVKKAVDSAKDITVEFPVELSENNGTTTMTVTGLGAHAAMPEMGKNALTAAIEILSLLPLAVEDKKIIDTLKKAFAQDIHGESLGLDFADESGRTTLNVGVMHWDENGIREFAIDMRCPITKKLADIKARVVEMLSPAGLNVFDEELKDGHFVPRDSELVSKLLDVYAARTGTYEEPLAIGGGTYARAISNAVAFGCEKIGDEAPIHMPNEFISIDDMMFNTYMIADAILALAAEE